MVGQTIQAGLVAVRELAAAVREFTFQPVPPAVLVFQAGQYMSLVIGEYCGKPLLRPYSLCSLPGADHVAFVANLVPGGAGTHRLFEMPVGDTIEMRGPKGHFVLDERGARDYLFVANGTGISPVRAMLLRLFQIGIARRITLFWELASAHDIYYINELDAWAAAHPNFSYTITLTAPDAGWPGAVGPVAELVAQRVTSVQELLVYVVGAGTMIDAVKQALRPKGLCPIRTEKFY